MALTKDDTIGEANFLLGRLYEEGLSVDHNVEYSYKYYLKATEQSYAKAFTKIGHFYYCGVKGNNFMNDTL